MRFPQRAVLDQDVDRLGVEVQRCMELTNTNCSFDLTIQHLMGCRGSPKFIDSVTHFSICRKAQRFADDHSLLEPPDPFPNSEVKPLSADGSVGLPM